MTMLAKLIILARLIRIERKLGRARVGLRKGMP